MKSLVSCTADGETNPIGLSSPPQFAWRFADRGGERFQSAWRLRAATQTRLLENDAADLWDSGWVVDPRQCGVAWKGRPLAAQSRVFWKVSVRDHRGEEHDGPALTFEMGPSPGEWDSADWLGHGWSAAGRALLFRTEFACPAPPVRVRLHVAGAGVHFARCNGQDVSEGVLFGGPFEPDQLVPYTSHDLTPLARVGANAVGVVVGHAWDGRRLLKALLVVDQADGSRRIIRTLRINGDDFWRCRPGGWFTDHLYDGVEYDARRQPLDWDSPCIADETPLREERWFPPRRMPGPSGRMWRRPVLVKRQPAIVPLPAGNHGGISCWDVGSVIAGWARLVVRAEAGTHIRVRYSELLDGEGRLNQEPLYIARAADTYICRGQGEETFETLLGYHGFRHMEVEGLPTDGRIEAVPVMSDCPVRATLRSSHPMLDALWNLYQQSESGNLLHLPTDCPNRTERMGWLNDMTGRGESLVWARTVGKLLAGWMEQIAAAQDGEGRIPDTVPFHWGHRAADPVCICPVSIPWRLWRHFGDMETLANMRPVGEQWLAWWLGQRQADGLINTHYWGDWCPPLAYCIPGGPSPGLPAPSLVATACIAHMADLLAKTCAALGDPCAAHKHRQTAEELARSIHDLHFNPGIGAYGVGDQCSQALMLAWGLAPLEERSRIARVLVEDVARRGHVTTGNIATLPLLQALSEAGRGDLAWGLLTRREYPSWGYMLEQGATTLWERWEGGEGMNMNSHNHPMLGVYVPWIIEHVVGLRDDESLPPGQGFVLSPALPPDLDSIEFTLDTIHGSLRMGLAENGRRLRLHVPPNTRLQLTGSFDSVIREDL